MKLLKKRFYKHLHHNQEEDSYHCLYTDKF